MKAILLFTAFLCLAITTEDLLPSNTQNISGIVTDTDDQPIIGANIFIKGTKKGTMTDSLGEFSMVIPSEIKTLTITHDGYKGQDVKVEGGKLKIMLESGPMEGKVTGLSRTEEDKAIRLRGYPPMRKTEAPMSERPPIVSSASPMESKMTHDASFTEGISDIDSYDAEESEPMSISDPKRKDESKQDTRAGQLTAGEWNDLNNWEAWNTLIEKADYKEMGQYWGINSNDRISVFVTNQYELPVADCLVTLKSDGEIIWTSNY